MFSISYNTPISTDTAVCLCFFSPAGFQNPKKNFLYVEGMLKRANIPYFTAECVIDNQTPFIQNPTLQVKSNSCLFYKEQLYNKLVPLVPEQYTKIIFIDADIIFSDFMWVDKISNLLNTHDVVQPFQVAIWLNKGNRTHMQALPSSVYGLQVRKIPPKTAFNGYHPGFSFAMTRAFFNKIGGFFDKCIFGGGDVMFLNLLNRNIGFQTRMKSVNVEYIKWCNSHPNLVVKFTYLSCTVYHLYHGTIINRQYTSRYDKLNQFNHVPFDNLFILNEHGVYETTNERIRKIMKDHFRSRNEDF